MIRAIGIGAFLALLIIGALFAALLRYTITPTGFRLDRLTGNVAICSYPEGCQPISTTPQPASQAALDASIAADSANMAAEDVAAIGAPQN